MNAPARLALFALVIVFVFAAAIGVGRMFRSDPQSPSPAVTHVGQGAG